MTRLSQAGRSRELPGALGRELFADRAGVGMTRRARLTHGCRSAELVGQPARAPTGESAQQRALPTPDLQTHSRAADTVVFDRSTIVPMKGLRHLSRDG